MHYMQGSFGLIYLDNQCLRSFNAHISLPPKTNQQMFIGSSDIKELGIRIRIDEAVAAAHAFAIWLRTITF